MGLLYSLDGGGTWNLIARGQPNRGSYDWTLPNVQTDQAKVVVVEPSDQTGSIADGVLAVSEAFSIDALVDVNDHGPAQLALRGITPNPAQNELHVSFSLSDSRAATLALFDVSGRQLSTRRVDGLGAGWHTVELRWAQQLARRALRHSFDPGRAEPDDPCSGGSVKRNPGCEDLQDR